ncbi:MAG TPA: hypothetical protein VFN35_01125, partial [Ktedonobacteraceae bacterium]|nr:hypothetical protein [Ktedonobacteraceae bacterium]
MARVRWITGFFILLLIVVGCGQTTSVTRSQVQPSPSTTPHSSYSYTRQAGAIVLQMFRTGGFAPAPFSEVLPRWSLYGDGTLVFRATNDTLMQAHLSQGQIDVVLKEVIDEKHIFASTKRDYSSYGADMFHWILHIKANGRELVVGVGDPVSSSTDVQIRRLRDIVDYLEVYARNVSDT